MCLLTPLQETTLKQAVMATVQKHSAEAERSKLAFKYHCKSPPPPPHTHILFHGVIGICSVLSGAHGTKESGAGHI